MHNLDTNFLYKFGYNTINNYCSDINCYFAVNRSKASFANQSQRNMVGWLGDNNYVNQEWDIHFDINSIYSVVTVENPLQQEIEMTDITIMDKDYMANNKFTVLDKTSIDNMSEVISASSDSLYF